MKFPFWTVLLAVCLISRVCADGWQPVGTPMSDGRWAGSAAVLADRKTGLVVGGYSFSAHRCVATADRFDSLKRCFIPCRGRLNVPRNFAAALPLPDGTVLVAGGFNTVWGSLDSAEIYHPAADTFELLPSRLTSPRELFTATPMTDGSVLFVGGFDTGVGKTQSSADIYHPAIRRFSYAASLRQDRFGHAAARLRDGRVLIVGGTHWFVGQPGQALASAEIYDPRTGQFHPTREPMHFARDRPTATTLPDGTILIAGGQNSAGEPTAAEIFHPDSETFSVLDSHLKTPRMAHVAGALPDGRILLAGGWSSPLQATTSATEFFDPRSELFETGPPLTESGHDQVLLVFPSGLVLAAGGKQVKGGREKSIASGCLFLPVTMQTP